MPKPKFLIAVKQVHNYGSNPRKTIDSEGSRVIGGMEFIVDDAHSSRRFYRAVAQ